MTLQVVKSILVVVGGVVGALLVPWYLRDIREDFTREGAILGIAWFIISSALDILVLVYLFQGMDLATWVGGDRDSLPPHAHHDDGDGGSDGAEGRVISVTIILC